MKKTLGFSLILALVLGFSLYSITNASFSNPTTGGSGGASIGSWQINGSGDIYNTGVTNKVGIGTTTPFAPLSVMGTVYQNGTYAHFGGVQSDNPCNTITASCLEEVGSDNTFLGVNVNVENINAGNLAYTGINLFNDLKSTATTNYSGLYLNSSVYNDPMNTFGSLNNVPNLLQAANSMGPVSIQSFAPTDAGSYVNFMAGSTTPGTGPSTAQEIMRITSKGVGIGTTTPLANFQVTASSTNATSTMEIGKTGQTAGGCLKMYNDAGTAEYVTIHGTTLTVSASTCKSGF